MKGDVYSSAEERSDRRHFASSRESRPTMKGRGALQTVQKKGEKVLTVLKESDSMVQAGGLDGRRVTTDKTEGVKNWESRKEGGKKLNFSEKERHTHLFKIQQIQIRG